MEGQAFVIAITIWALHIGEIMFCTAFQENVFKRSPYHNGFAASPGSGVNVDMTTASLNAYSPGIDANGSRPKGSYSELTSIRGIAALWVVLYHFRIYCDPYVPDFVMRILDHGYLAVDIFFILSGFVIYLNYGHKFQNLSRHGFRRFLVKRLARIYPLHLFMLIAYLSVPGAMIMFRPGSALPDQFSFSDFFLNISLVHNWGWTSQMTWNFPSWSISSEWAAYLLFPPLAVIISKFGRNPVFLLALCTSSLVLLALLYFMTGQSSIGHNITHLGTLRCILEFTSGAALCALYPGKRSTWFLAAGTGVALVLILMFCFGLAPDYLLVPGSIVLLMFAIVGSNSFIASWLRHRPLVYLGDISYSTYMLHALVIQWIKFLIVKEDESLHWIWILLYLAIVLVGSHILYRYVEKPSQKFINGLAHSRWKERQLD